MKKDPAVVAQKVLQALGGKENVVSVTHCATRLRVTLKDAGKVDANAFKEIPGVAGYFEKSGQHQVILGTGFVNKVCDEVQKLTGASGESGASASGEKEKLSFQSVTKMISDIFIPIIPVLLATGILMGLRSLLINGFGIAFSPEFDAIYTILTDTAYTFIPVLVAWSACRKFGGSPILGIVLGLMLVSPNLPDKWAVVNGTEEALHMNIGPLALNITGYQSSVIPALFMGFFAATLEKKLHKVIPDIVDLLLVPFLTLLISLLVGLFAVGPILMGIEKGLTDLILQLLTLPFGIGGIAYGGLIQILCSVGMHHTVTPIIVSIFTETGVDYINPMGSAAIAGQLGAGLAIVLMQKNKQTRANMIPALIPALFGISEPVMYGLTFPRIKPFFMGCLGGAVGGGFAAIVGLCAQGTGASMFPGMLLYLQEGMLQYIIVLALSIGVGFAGTWLTMRKNTEQEN
ncbi:MAG: PTS transporter subunit EIIC [Eubacteriales bacterium]|nr:PTS transporter subunit EIIC [Eubacteriales bacterium]